MITFQEWLEKTDPKTFNEFKFLDRFMHKNQSNARPFNDEEKRKLALLQKKEKPEVLDYKNSKPPAGDLKEIKWRG